MLAPADPKPKPEPRPWLITLLKGIALACGLAYFVVLITAWWPR
jgi:hypothetical protein